MIEKLKGYLQKENNEIVGIASTAKEDRQGESIKQEGWDLKNFKKNPVLLASHQYQEFPIGKVTNVRVQDGNLTFKAIFSEATQKAKEAYQLVQEGILNTFSVGFIPREYDAKNASIITKAELLEISLVAVPANPEAVVIAKTMEKNDLVKSLVKEWLLDETLKKQVDDLEVGKTEEEEAKDEEETKPEKVEDTTAEDTTPEKEEVKENGKAGGEVEDINLKLIQKTVGHLQDLCREIKKKGGATK